MKKCPKCQRTFEDMYSFCLEDGSVLSPSINQYAPPTIASAEPKTEILPGAVKNRPWKFFFIGLISLFAIFLIVGALYYLSVADRREAAQSSAGNSNPFVKPTTAASVSPTPSPTPGAVNNSNANAANTNLRSNSASPSPSASKTPESETPDGAVKKLKQGMSYAAARKMLMASGWQAVTQSPNRELFGQEEYIVNTLKYYEMDACSGTGMGYCRFLFRDVNKRKLVVVTGNNEEGIKGGPLVENWSFEK